jgi:hypothetical protein
MQDENFCICAVLPPLIPNTASPRGPPPDGGPALPRLSAPLPLDPLVVLVVVVPRFATEALGRPPQPAARSPRLASTAATTTA